MSCRTPVAPMSRRVVLWLGVGVLFAGGIWGVLALTPEGPQGTNLPVIEESDHVQGSAEATVTLVEYGDFQCPACSAYFFLLQQLKEEFAEELQVVYRHYPLRSIHPQAQLASQASEAAALQGKFWEMHDVLYENQGGWANNSQARDIFIAYAQDLGLDETQFVTDLDSNEVKEKVQRDLTGGNVAGVRGTPTFFLNGQHVPNPQSLEAFRNVILKAFSS